MGGVFAAVQPGGGEALLEHVVDPVLGDPGMPAGDEQGVGVCRAGLGAHGQPVLDGALTGGVEVDHPLFIALAQYPQPVSSNVGEIQPHQLRDPQAAVQKQGDDAEISFGIVSVDGLQQLDALVQGQIARQGLPDLGRIQLLDRVFLQKLGL